MTEPIKPDSAEALVREIAEHHRDGDIDGNGNPKTLTEGQAWASLTQYIGRARALVGLPQRFSDGVMLEVDLALFSRGGEQRGFCDAHNGEHRFRNDPDPCIGWYDSPGAPEPAAGGLVDHRPEDGEGDGQRD